MTEDQYNEALEKTHGKQREKMTLVSVWKSMPHPRSIYNAQLEYYRRGGAPFGVASAWDDQIEEICRLKREDNA